jgi:hypothetical protein
MFPNILFDGRSTLDFSPATAPAENSPRKHYSQPVAIRLLDKNH